MQIFLSAFDDIPDPRAGNARHDLGELLVVAFVAVLCGATSCADMNRPVFTGGQNSRRIAHYGTDTKEEDREAVFT